MLKSSEDSSSIKKQGSEEAGATADVESAGELGRSKREPPSQISAGRAETLEEEGGATPTSDTGQKAGAGPPGKESLSPMQTGGNSSISSLPPPLHFSRKDGFSSIPSPPSPTTTAGKKSGDASGRAVTAPASSPTGRLPTPQRRGIKDYGDLEDLKEKFQSGLYSMLQEPKTIQALRDLLTCQDKTLRHKAWELVLKHAVPVMKEAEEGGGKFIVNLGIPRPERDVTPGG